MPNIPTPEHPQQPQTISATPETANFCPTSLIDWLELCQRARVPFVPAEQIASINRDDWLRFDQEGEHKGRLAAAQREIHEKLRPGHMFRFDFCAPLELKIRMSNGQPGLHPDMTRVNFDDPRAYTLLFEQPRELIPVHQRPWINPTMLDGYPVEYRAFVREGKLQGISNYYPQRPLPMNNFHIQVITQLTAQLTEAAKTPFLWNESPMKPWVETRYGLDGVHFTADFMVTQEDNVLFIEGGPPHEMGAHPCCFQHGRISGIALEDRNDQREDGV